MSHVNPLLLLFYMAVVHYGMYVQHTIEAYNISCINYKLKTVSGALAM